MHTIHQVRRNGITQLFRQIGKRSLLHTKLIILSHYNSWTPLCYNAIKTVPLPIRTGSQTLGTTCDRGQAFPRSGADSTGTGEMILNSTQLICIQVNHSSLYTSYITPTFLSLSEIKSCYAVRLFMSNT